MIAQRRTRLSVSPLYLQYTAELYYPPHATPLPRLRSLSLAPTARQDAEGGKSRIFETWNSSMINPPHGQRRPGFHG